MKKVSIRALAVVIRSKNAGPYELTFDLIFKDSATYQRVKKSGFFTPELFAELYRVPLADVISFVEFDPANAIKCTIRRPRAAGDVGETDVYGAQQHAPLLDLAVPIDAEVIP
ncbi:DUF4387 domain-containing protein [Zhaonella formicivorans]|uniref:DUF4387 domain-containing protein n=1 Tax=Zhaonella formicivorans TaxID=2528593 RepID=UPI0010F3F9EE|nr:DUF4387 domain-containing protein [Zhaonella formicivorans]